MDNIKNRIQKHLNRLNDSLTYHRFKKSPLFKIYAIGGPSFIVRQNITIPGLVIVEEYLKLERLPLFTRHLEVHLTEGNFLIFNLEWDAREVCTYQPERPQHTIEFKS